MIDTGAIESLDLQRDPFAWGVTDAFLPDRSLLGRLLDAFPREGYVRTERAPGAGQKAYCNHNITAMKDGRRDEAVWASLAPEWRALLDAVASPEYRRALEKVSGRRLQGSRIEARFTLYEAGDWISPHTDRLDKVLTQVVYFTRRWDPAWSGGLRILRSCDLEDVVREIFPLPNTSVIILPSESSWHGVAPVRPRVSEVRRSLLLHYSEPGPRAA